MEDINQSKVTLINYRDGQERFTRYTLQSAVEMIRTGKLKSGKQLNELTELPRICFACAIKNQYGQQWNYIYNGFILLEINNLQDRKTAEEIRDEAAMIDYTMLAWVGIETYEQAETPSPSSYSTVPPTAWSTWPAGPLLPITVRSATSLVQRVYRHTDGYSLKVNSRHPLSTFATL